MSLLEKVVGGTGVLIAAYLILTNPQGDNAVANSIKTAFVPGVKALQGR